MPTKQAETKGGITMAKEEKQFEEYIAELEKIVNDLENGSMSLEDSIKNFEKGMEVSKKCSEILENAEGKITKMIKENGELKEESFEV